MAMDKKSAAGQLRLVVMAAIGESMVIRAPSQAQLSKVLKEYGAS
jgi:3-dehydroquinate synthetase